MRMEGRRSLLPSAYRYSMPTFFPSTHPSSRRPCRNALCQCAVTEEEYDDRSPIRGGKRRNPERKHSQHRVTPFHPIPRSSRRYVGTGVVRPRTRSTPSWYLAYTLNLRLGSKGDAESLG